MKERIFNKLLPLLALILTTGWMISGCTDERESGSPSNGKDKLVSFSVRVPGAGTPKTYALDDNDENEVKNIVILLFDNNDKYTYQPVYNNKITTDGGNIAIKTFTARVPEGTYKSMVILANANSIVSNALSSINQGDPKASVLEKLTLTNGKWNSDPASGGYVPIPMWGEIADVTVNGSLGEINTSLVRMVAKIDVSLNAASQAKFKLKSVRLYNYNNKGQIAPVSSNWDNAAKEVTAPSVPSSAAKPSDPAQTPFVYDGAAITTTDIACTGEIYTFEAVKGAGNTLSANTCLVVGGYFGSDTQETFYRIDFANIANGTVTYLDILRNHHYKVVIQDVGARGLATDKDAFNSAPANIKASVVQWSDGKFTEFAVNDQYILGVSQGTFTFSREKRDAASLDNILSIMTDYTGGWKITDIVDAATNGTATWLTTDKVSGTNAAGDDVKLLLDENTTGAQRTAHVLVTADAGRLVYRVKVTQDVMTDIGIYITDTSNKDISVLEFSAAADVQPDMQQIKLSWAPKVNDVFVAVSAIKNGGFTFVGGSDNITNGSVSDPSGTKTFSIQPPAITTANINSDPFYERSSVILYSISDGIRTVNKALMLRQFVYNLKSDNKNSYMTDGKTYSFFVKCNAEFKIKTVSESPITGSEPTLLALKATDNLKPGTIGGNNISTGTEIKFTTLNISAGVSSKITLVLESTANPARFNDVTVEFTLLSEYYPEWHKGWAGSNIYWDGSKMTFDDVDVRSNQTIQGLYFQWGSLWGISPMGGWSGSVIMYSPNGTSGPASFYGYSTWASWPQIGNAAIPSNPPAGKTARDRNYLYERNGVTPGIGDICKHLTEQGWAPGAATGKKWRLPTSQEFESKTDYQMQGTWSATTSTAADGKFVIPAYLKRNSMEAPYLPASGIRFYSGGSLGYVGSNGFYWSGSPNGRYGYYLNFYSSGVDPAISSNRALGYSVRCVQE